MSLEINLGKRVRKTPAYDALDRAARSDYLQEQVFEIFFALTHCHDIGSLRVAPGSCSESIACRLKRRLAAVGNVFEGGTIDDKQMRDFFVLQFEADQ